MASFFNTAPNASLLAQIGQNQARANQSANNIGQSVSQVGDVFTNYNKQQEAARQREITNARNAEADARAQANLALNQEAGQRAAANQLFNQNLKNPNSAEFKALQEAGINDFRKRQKIIADNKVVKPTFQTMFKQLPGGGIQSVKVPSESAEAFAKNGFSLGSFTPGKKGTGKGTSATSNSKAGQEISKIIGGIGNESTVAKQYTDWKNAKLPDTQFLNYLYQAGAGDLGTKGWTDFGKKDLDTSGINSILDAAKQGNASGGTVGNGLATSSGRPNVPYNGATGGATAPIILQGVETTTGTTAPTTTQEVNNRLLGNIPKAPEYRGNYDKLPEYAKKFLSLDKYLENEERYNTSYRLPK